ncbi:MAG: inositol monophosphatase [Oscillospiraceae bacterium]|jgi:myo-inositol-1(or 4)-monophosphatase|nr:inositol monophosphatase [Oscillospiraceae bacterium]
MLEQMIEIVRNAGEILRGAQNITRDVREKTSHLDLVTAYDLQVQEQLRRDLLALLPEAGFFGEEDESHDIEGKTAVFIVDPIDGTTNFIRNLHHSCISVGLQVDGKMEYAVVFNPYYDEMFSARRGKGAFLNGARIFAANRPMRESLLLFGSAIYYRESLPATVRLVQELLPRTLDFRRGGSAALDLCYIAAGWGDVLFECCLSPWDYAAGSLIASEAGAVVTALDGSPLRFHEKCSIAAGGAQAHSELCELARRIKNEPGMERTIR